MAILTMSVPVRAQEPKMEFEPYVSYTAVEGDESTFREHSWTEEGAGGGVERFSYRSTLDDGAAFSTEGHARLNSDDYGITFEYRRESLGSFRAGYSQFTKYFDDTGGFFESFQVPSFDLDRDLELDIGHAFFEAELALENWPELHFSYEHGFKEGEKSLTGWGAVTQSGLTRNIHPTYKAVDESLDTVKIEVDHTIDKVRLYDEFQYEHFESETSRHERERDIGAGTMETVTVDESQTSDSVSNTFHSEVAFSDTMFASAGYLYSRYEGDADFDMRTAPFDDPFDKNWSASRVDLDRRNHILNLNLMAGPYKDLQVSGGIEAALSTTEGETDAVLTEIGFGGGLAEPEAEISTDKDRKGLEESLDVEYRGLPRTTIYGSGQWSQHDVQLDETEIEDGSVGFERATDTDRDGMRYKIGFSTSPVRRVTLSGHYKYEIMDNDYEHETDTLPNGYSAFINDQEVATNEFGARLSVQPKTWIRASLSYRLVDTQIDTTFDNDPSSVQTGNYDAGIYTLDATLTPVSKLFLTTIVSYQDIRAAAFDNGSDSVIPYEGDVFSSTISASYALDERNALSLHYVYSFSDNFEDNSESGLPLLQDYAFQQAGAGYSRKLKDNIEAKITYEYHDYDADHNNGVNDYTAHLVSFFLSLSL
jgi:opacity protein-like surface antigen